MSAQSINLIPEEERISQVKTRVVKFSTILTIILALIVSGVAGYYYLEANKLRTELDQVEAEISSLRGGITALADIEIIARNLYQKSETLANIFETRFYYSRLISQLEQSRPETVLIDSYNMGRDDTLNLTGTAENYNAVQDFINILLENQMFTQVQLNSVGLESSSGRVNYFVVVSYNGELLHAQE